MAYKALYREWRPQTFADVVGQVHVVTTLQNALRQGRLAHAYLFAGPRGTGKTTMAKLLAKAVNCERPLGVEPCNECAACIGITAGVIVDVTEMDAASNRGVDEIRSLLEQVQYMPTEVRRKVYIIDEVHMLTTEAFNALLKTLEEPPAYCLFVLATTELHKVPATIASRCQRFDFGRASAELVVERLRLVAAGIETQVEDAALWQIARASEGGLRDALSLLDQALSFASDRLDVEAVSAVLGGVPSDRLGQLYGALFRRDTAGLLAQLSLMWERGADPGQVVSELIAYGRDAILLKNGVTSGGADHRGKYDPTFSIVIRDIPLSEILPIIERLARVQAELRYQSQPQLVVEMTLVVCCERMDKSVEMPIVQTRMQEPPAHADPEVAKLRVRIDQLEQWVHQMRDRPSQRMTPAAHQELGAPPADAQASSAEIVTDPPDSLADPVTPKPPVTTHGSAGQSRKGGDEKPPARTRPAQSGVRAGGGAVSGQRLRPMTPQERDGLQGISGRWSELLEDVKQRSVQTRAWLLAGRPEAVCEGSLWVVFKGALHAETVMKSPHAELIAELVEARFGLALRLQAVTEDAWTALQEAVIAQHELAPAIEVREPWVEKVVEWFGEDCVTILEE